MQTKSALTAIALVTLGFAVQAHADTIVRFPPKGGVPYTVQLEEPRFAYRAPVHHKKPREAHKTHHESVVKTAAGYHVIR